jgi:lipopolysaccharide/colanic/teichoic acid biosynthesis glycosyltransferase
MILFRSCNTICIYVKNHSLFLDVVILFQTVGVVLTGKGAQ